MGQDAGVRWAPLFLLFVPAFAAAHSIDTPKTDVVRVEPDSLAVSIDYVISPAEAADLRKVYDADSNGRIEGKEREAFTRWIAIAATRFAAVSLDGRKLTLVEDEAARAIEGLEARATSSAEIRASFTLRAAIAPAPGAHRLLIGDRHKDAAIAVPVRVVFAGGLAAAKDAH